MQGTTGQAADASCNNSKQTSNYAYVAANQHICMNTTSVYMMLVATAVLLTGITLQAHTLGCTNSCNTAPEGPYQNIWAHGMPLMPKHCSCGTAARLQLQHIHTTAKSTHPKLAAVDNSHWQFACTR